VSLTGPVYPSTEPTAPSRRWRPRTRQTTTDHARWLRPAASRAMTLWPWPGTRRSTWSLLASGCAPKFPASWFPGRSGPQSIPRPPARRCRPGHSRAVPQAEWHRAAPGSSV